MRKDAAICSKSRPFRRRDILTRRFNLWQFDERAVVSDYVPAETRPELLAPAGDWDSLRAAVSNGADAVYFGLSNFNARHRAANFTLEELPEVMAYLHGHNVRGYVVSTIPVYAQRLC